MAPDVSDLEHVIKEPIRLSPGSIEPEFERIWRDAANAGLGESSIRLRVLNFVAIATNDDARRRYDDVMERLPQSHPCRAVLARTQPGDADVTSEISARCWLTGGRERHVCSEEVVLEAGEQRVRALTSAVLALIVPALPVALWLIEAGDVGHPLLREIASAADQVFVDSAGAADLSVAFGQICDAEQNQEFEVRDLAWERLIHLRSLIAQFFDGRDRLAELMRLRSINIVSGGAQPSSESLLLAGWLVSRLDLALADLDVDRTCVEATLYQGTRGVQLRLDARPDTTRAVEEVRLETQHATFVIQQPDEGRHLLVCEEWEDGASTERAVEPGAVDDASLIAAALDRAGESDVFLESVEAARIFAG